MQTTSEISEQKNTQELLDVEKKTFKQYLFLFSGQQVSLLGSSIVSFAIVWWITITTQSEMMLGIASLIALGPYVLAAPFSGLLADKFNRKTLLIIFDTAQAVLTVVLSILFMTNHASLAVVFVILGLRGTAQAFHTPVSMSILPSMVPQKHLSRMNGLSYLFGGLINIVGPAIGAALFAIPGINIGMILWADVITYAIALIPLLVITIPSVNNKEEKEENVPFIVQMTEGFTALKSIKGMVALLVGAMFVNFFMSPLNGLLPMFVNKVHGGTEANYALVVGLLQAALVLGGLIMAIFKGVKKPVLFFLGSILFQTLCQISLIFIPTTLPGRFWIIGGLLFLFAIPFAFIDVSFITSLQILIPKEKMGRVTATIMAITPAIRPLGYFLSGVIAEYTGINIVLVVSAITSAVVLLLIYLFTPLRHLDSVIQKTLEENSKEQVNEELISDSIIVDEEAISLKTAFPEPIEQATSSK
jgi:DHA3 family macrolide efflux protein-like MFS transporter